MRNLISPSAGSTIVDRLKPYEGGTGADSAPNALAALGGVPRTSIGQNNGVAGLDANGKLLLSQLPIDQFPTDSIKGPTSLVKNTAGTYLINNYDVFTDYTVTTTFGTVAVVGDTITYTAPNNIGTGGFTINGRAVTVAVTDFRPDTPVLTGTHSADGATNARYDANSSTFNIQGVSNTHLNTDWELSPVSDFSSILYSSYADIVNKTSWSQTGLARNTTYYIRCRYRSSGNYVSDWSNVFAFTTSESYSPNTEEAKIYATDRNTNNLFGQAIDIDGTGTRVVVGAILGNSNFGCAYVFVRSGNAWIQEQKIVGTDTVNGDQLGCSVAIDGTGTRIAVGARQADPGGTSNAGAVYIFSRSGSVWTQEQKLIASDKATSDALGYSVCMDGTGTRVVGGAMGVPAGSSAGAVYVYVRSGTTWTFEQKFTGSDTVNGNQFAYSVNIDSTGTRIVAGAWAATVSGVTGSGASYVFTRSGSVWSQEAKIVASDLTAGANFGYYVNIDDTGSRCVVGARNIASSAGAVYIFTRSGTTWSQEQKITASDASANSFFGYSVAFNSDATSLIVGAFRATVNGQANAGAVYHFTRSGTVWTQQTKITASDNVTNKYFGNDVAWASSSTRIAVAAYQDSDGGFSLAGAAYIFR